MVTRPARTLLPYILLLTIPALPLAGYAQPVAEQNAPLLAQPGILITLVLILIPLLAAFIFMIWQVRRTLLRLQWQKQPIAQADQLEYLEGEAIDATRLQRNPTLVYQLSGRELAGAYTPDDSRGIIQQASNEHAIPFVAEKKKAQSRPTVDPKLTRLILWYL